MQKRPVIVMLVDRSDLAAKSVKWRVGGFEDVGSEEGVGFDDRHEIFDTPLRVVADLAHFDDTLW